MKHTIYGKSDGLNFIPDARYRWHNALQHFAGKSITVTVERKTRVRTLPQNSYYWGCLITNIHLQLISDGWEVTQQQVHEMLKAKYLLAERYNEKTGEVMQIIRSTTEISTVEHNQYCEDVRRWAAETLGMNLPEPNEYNENRN